MRRVVVSEFVTLDGVFADPGGAEGLAHGGCLDHDLVDELRLMIFPTVLGRGATLFGGLDHPAGLTVSAVRRLGETVLVTLHRQQTSSMARAGAPDKED